MALTASVESPFLDHLSHLIHPQCQPTRSHATGGEFQMSCCVSLYSSCLDDGDCCPVKGRDVKCMSETDVFGNIIEHSGSHKRCLIKDDYCTLTKTGDTCQHHEDCCGCQEEIQSCQKAGTGDHSQCCRVEDVTCQHDSDCCSEYCNPSTKATSAICKSDLMLVLTDMQDSKLHEAGRRMHCGTNMLSGSDLLKSQIGNIF